MFFCGFVPPALSVSAPKVRPGPSPRPGGESFDYQNYIGRKKSCQSLFCYSSQIVHNSGKSTDYIQCIGSSIIQYKLQKFEISPLYVYAKTGGIFTDMHDFLHNYARALQHFSHEPNFSKQISHLLYLRYLIHYTYLKFDFPLILCYNIYIRVSLPYFSRPLR